MAVTLPEIKKLLKEMFKEFKKETEEMFQKQEKAVLDIIGANIKIINDRFEKVEKNVDGNANCIKKLTKELEDIKVSLNFNEGLIDEKIVTNNKYLDKKMEHTKIDNVLKEKQRNLEDRSRRNNLRIEGIYENDKESWGDTEKKVQTFFTEKLGLKDVEIERAHRTGRKNDGRPRTIILNLQKYKDKLRILKELYRLKGTNTFVNEDFSRETVAIRKKLFAEVKERRLNGESVTVRYDKIVYIKTSFKNNFNE
ncbi:uncharacterized protein LOC105843398 [Hydra vulgaris]|uniref:uncharacterized protein LOC105843398 n=1 Tax=Hydra vulgaris TaxID=6087 RepID=UPI0032E9F459